MRSSLPYLEIEILYELQTTGHGSMAAGLGDDPPRCPLHWHHAHNANGISARFSAEQASPSLCSGHGSGSSNAVGEGSVSRALACACCPADIRRSSQLRSPSPPYGFSRGAPERDQSLDPSH